jgi:hypothetical protein
MQQDDKYADEDLKEEGASAPAVLGEQNGRARFFLYFVDTRKEKERKSKESFSSLERSGSIN